MRRAKNALVAVSLLLTLLCVAIWVRSWFVGEAVQWTPVWRENELSLEYVSLSLWTNPGKLSVGVDNRKSLFATRTDQEAIFRELRGPVGSPFSWSRWDANWKKPPDTPFWQRVGFFLAFGHRPPEVGQSGGPWVRASAPCWFLVLLFGLLPIWRLAARGGDDRGPECGRRSQEGRQQGVSSESFAFRRIASDQP